MLLSILKLTVMGICLILSFLLLWLYMIPGVILRFALGKDCPEWVVYGLGIVTALVYRLSVGSWYIRIGDPPILSFAGLGLCILNLIFGYSFVWSGYRVASVLMDSKKSRIG